MTQVEGQPNYNQLFHDSEIPEQVKEPVDPRVGSVVTQFKEYLTWAEFNSQEAIAFRDLVDLLSAQYDREGYSNPSQRMPTADLTFALVYERMSSRANDNQEYYYSVSKHVRVLSDAFPEDEDITYGFTHGIVSNLKDLRDELFYPRRKEIEGR